VVAVRDGEHGGGSVCRSPPLAGIALPIAACGGGNSSGAAGASSPATTPAPPFRYAVNTKSDEVSQYSASPSDFGALTPLAPSTVRTGPFPYGIAIDPQGNSVYVANEGSVSASANGVSRYTINQNTGRLTPKSPATVASGRGPVAIAVAPNGKSAYVVSGPNAIWQYNINPTTGALTPKSPATVATGPNPEPIAVTPHGKYAYVANCPGCSAKLRNSRSASPSKPATNTIWEYRINQSTGALRPKPIAIVAIGTGANAIAITPDSKSLYVAVGSIWQYSINPTTGKLTPMSSASVATASGSLGMAVTPGR
jgi:DNA-binding beta-propeller fold protein YncE